MDRLYEISPSVGAGGGGWSQGWNTCALTVADWFRCCPVRHCHCGMCQNLSAVNTYKSSLIQWFQFMSRSPRNQVSLRADLLCVCVRGNICLFVCLLPLHGLMDSFCLVSRRCWVCGREGCTCSKKVAGCDVQRFFCAWIYLLKQK